VAVRVEGKVGVPFRQTGIKTEPFAKDLICANIYVKKTEWEAPLKSYRRFLWLNLDNAIWICVEKLRKRTISIDREKLAKDLLLVGAEYLGDDFKSEELNPVSKDEALPVDKYSDDEEQRVVIQYQRDDQNDPWDFDRKVAFENLLNESLCRGDLGFCDCVDFDSGTVNAICSVSNAKKATKAIIQTLLANGRLNGAVIEETVKGKRKVVWPEGFVGGIEYI
jgi:hypothetical protein